MISDDANRRQSHILSRREHLPPDLFVMSIYPNDIRRYVIKLSSKAIQIENSIKKPRYLTLVVEKKLPIGALDTLAAIAMQKNGKDNLPGK